jgi:hypothetical protein
VVVCGYSCEEHDEDHAVSHSRPPPSLLVKFLYSSV